MAFSLYPEYMVSFNIFKNLFFNFNCIEVRIYTHWNCNKKENKTGDVYLISENINGKYKTW